ENNRDGLRRRQQGPHSGRVAAHQYDSDPAANEIGRHPGHAIQLTVGPAILDRDVPAFDEASFTQASTESLHVVCPFRSRHAIEDPNHRDCRLLPTRRKRPRRCHAAEQRDEIAPVHSITSSAMAESPGGISRPSALAALRLITNSNLVDCSTGRSLALAPFKIRPT